MRLSGRGSLTSLLVIGLRPPASESRCARVGRVTAPVGRVSTSLPTDVSTVGVEFWGGACRASRPLSTRERRSSSSSGTPGIRVAAPVAGGNATVSTLAGRPTVRSTAESALGGLAGRPVNKGSEPITLLAKAASALVGLRSALPICFALADVTARNCTGLTLLRCPTSSARSAVNRAGWLW